MQRRRISMDHKTLCARNIKEFYYTLNGMERQMNEGHGLETDPATGQHLLNSEA